MDRPEDEFATRGRLLLSQLDDIFVSDPLIDELGFVHPAQLTSLHSAEESKANDLSFSKLESKNSVGSTASESIGGEESQARSDCSRKTEHGVNGLDDEVTSLNEKSYDGLPYDPTAFWCGDHKLAISMLALAPMYKYAKSAFVSIRTDYKKLLQAEQDLNLAESRATDCDSGTMKASVEDTHGGKLATLSAEKLRLEDSLLSYSRALILINCDYASAWNTRKQIILSRAVNQESLTGELHIASVVLSYGPKSEETWAYRRWVINQMITGGISRAELELILEGESKLVEGADFGLTAGFLIAVSQRSLMNYRAWRHRCWLVPQMSSVQLVIELYKTKVWASAHVADNCGFHYRRSLLLQLMKSRGLERNQISLTEMTAVEKGLDMKSLRVSLLDSSKTRVIWKEEMDWTKNLIQQYIGREALWIHLRFLLFSWVHHIDPTWSCPNRPSLSAICKRVPWDAQEAQLAIYNEQNFGDCCLSACNGDLTEEKHRQQEFAATYKLWVLTMGSKRHEDGETEFPASKQVDFKDLEQLLHDVVPRRKQLWEGLLPNFQYSHARFAT